MSYDFVAKYMKYNNNGQMGWVSGSFNKTCSVRRGSRAVRLEPVKPVVSVLTPNPAMAVAAML